MFLKIEIYEALDNSSDPEIRMEKANVGPQEENYFAVENGAL